MHFKLMLFCILIHATALAQEGGKSPGGYDPILDAISPKYEAGPFLIYDCVENHFACVLETYAEDCRQQRRQDQAERKHNLSCAPITLRPNKKSCFQMQLMMTSQNHGTRFCVGHYWKQKLIDLD